MYNKRQCAKERPEFESRSGVALITALGMLALFVAFGTAYLGYMVSDHQEADVALRAARARAMAEGGVRAAIGEIQSHLAVGTALPNSITVSYPIYQPDVAAAGTLLPRSDRSGKAEVGISDECARVNLNVAPTRVLESILNVSADVARKIRSSLPRDDSGAIISATADRRWLTTVDDLVTRQLVDPAIYDAVDKDLLTVYSVPDTSAPTGYLNPNTAPPQVLAAVLNLSPEAAKAFVATREKTPLKSLADLTAAAGKSADTFNIPPAAGAPESAPPDFTFASRCYRLRSHATLADLGSEEQETAKTTAAVEAVVYFPENGDPVVQYWVTKP